MGTILRIVWKEYRFELAAVVAAIVALAVAALLIVRNLNDVWPGADCLDYWMQNAADKPGCDASTWLGRLEDQAGELTGALTFIPAIAGVLLGSVVVSREIEHRTAQLGWSLSASRRRWLTERVLPVGLLLVLLLAGLAIAAELLEGAKDPLVAPRASLQDYGLRGLPVVVRGIAAFGVAVLVGALAGRQLPALILGAVAALVVSGWVVGLYPYGVPTEWVSEEYAQQQEGSFSGADRFLGTGYRAPDGTVLTYDQAFALSPYGPDDERAYEWLGQRYTTVEEVLRGTNITEIELRESLILGAITVLTLGAAFVVVDRRRPY